MNKCTINKCNTESKAPRGHCWKHYKRWQLYGDVDFVKQVKEFHGKRDSAEYNNWSAMKSRCYNKNFTHYSYYGGRGIKVCDRWLHSFNNFLEDMGEKPGKNYTIDRIDNDSDYSPDNCRWATKKEQSRNSRLRKDNTSGHRGVSLNKYNKHKKFVVNLGDKRIGAYRTLEEAVVARRRAEKKEWG